MSNGYMEMRSNLIALMQTQIGLCIDFFDILAIMQSEDGQFAVCVAADGSKTYYDEDGEEYLFKSAKKAVDFFLKKREERQLGFDYEVDSNDQSNTYKSGKNEPTS